MADPYSPNINCKVNYEGFRYHLNDWTNQVTCNSSNHRQFTIRYRQHHYHVVGLSFFITGGATPRLPRRSAAVARIGSGKDPNLYLLGRYAQWSPHYGRVPDDWPNIMRLIESQWIGKSLGVGEASRPSPDDTPTPWDQDPASINGQSVRCYHPGQCRGFHKNNAAVFDNTLAILLRRLKRTRKHKDYFITAMKTVGEEADAYTAATGHSMEVVERHDYLVEVFRRRVTANA